MLKGVWTIVYQWKKKILVLTKGGVQSQKSLTVSSMKTDSEQLWLDTQG